MIFNEKIVKQGGGGTDTSDATLTSGGQMLDGVTAYAKGVKYTGTIPSKDSTDLSASNNVVTVPAGYYATNATKTVGAAKAAATYYPSASDQSISAGQYLTGVQTIEAVTTTNLSAANIKTGVTVQVGDSADSDRVASVTGTYTSDATLDSGGQMLSGVTAYAKGTKYTGSIATKTSSDMTVSGATVTAPAGYYANATSKSVATGTAGTPTATKGTVTNNSVTVTPSVTNATGYITGGTKTGTAVTVSASELVSGTKTINASGTTDVTNYASASVAAGSATTPATTVTASPSISVNSSTGLITATASATKSVTPTVSAGYVSSGTAGTITVSGSNTRQLTTKAAETYTPGTTNQTIASGQYLTGAQTIQGDANLVAGNIKEGVTVFGVEGTFEGGGLFPQLIVTGPTTGSTVVATKGASTVTLTESSGTWTGNLTDYGVWTVTATLGTDSATDTVNVDEVKQYTIELSYVHIYGVVGNPYSGQSAFSRTDESANFTDPVPYVSGASGYSSPFDDLYPWRDMTRVTDATAGELVKIPKFWYKVSASDGGGVTVKISTAAQDGYSVCPACMDRGDGNGERDFVYVGRYHCLSSNYKSTKGTPKASITRSTARTNIQNLGTGLYLMDYATYFTIQLLYLVEFANWNVQSKIGYGCGNNSSVENTGYTDTMPYHTGTMKSSRTTYGVGTQYRNIEGLWDDVCDYIDGCYFNSNGLNVIIKPSNFSDSSNGTLIAKPMQFGSNGTNIKSMEFSNSVFQQFYPYRGNSSGAVSDYYTYDASKPCLYVGGCYTQSQTWGLFFGAGVTTSRTVAFIGCRLMKLP